MIIYDATVPEFLNHVHNDELVGLIDYNLREKFGIKTKRDGSEWRSWERSLPEVSKLFKDIKGDKRKVLIEFNIPTSKKRIDFIVLGTNEKGIPSAWVMELKQWSKITEVAWNEFRVGRYTDSHPSDQADDYKSRLLNEMGMENKIDIEAGAYLHNLDNHDSPLYNEQYEVMVKAARLYSQLENKDLADSIEKHTIIKDGSIAFDYFKEAKWKPSKTFKEIVKENFKTIPLVGTQKLIYKKIENFVRSKNKEEKMTFLISGDPGSGKTVIAFKLLNLMVGELELKMQMMIPGQEVRNAFIDQLRDNLLSSKISGSVMWSGYDSAIIDEAHKAVARDTGTVNYENNYKTMDLAIIFIDDDQVINKKGLTKDEVKEIAIRNGHKVYEYEIEENFRSSGERAMLDWIDCNFYGRTTVSGEFEYELDTYKNKEVNYKLNAYETAKEFTDEYFRTHGKESSTRITSLWHKGYYFGPADKDGYPEPSFTIGEVPFVWNPNEEWLDNLNKKDRSFYKTYNNEVKMFANDRKLFLTGGPKGFAKPNSRFIAYFNHIQGYEFENIFVYIPKVITMENGEILFHRDELADEVKISQTWAPKSKAKGLKGRDPYKLNKGYFINRVKVMMTRGTKSTHIFAEDEELNDFLNEKIK